MLLMDFQKRKQTDIVVNEIEEICTLIIQMIDNPNYNGYENLIKFLENNTILEPYSNKILQHIKEKNLMKWLIE